MINEKILRVIMIIIAIYSIAYFLVIGFMIDIECEVEELRCWNTYTALVPYYNPATKTTMLTSTTRREYVPCNLPHNYNGYVCIKSTWTWR